jgi:hypothetical protein
MSIHRSRTASTTKIFIFILYHYTNTLRRFEKSIELTRGKQYNSGPKKIKERQLVQYHRVMPFLNFKLQRL